ncbi:hypothetical protein DUNSADRAFT_9050 [Dunaliella salina]|uniref:Encoded protein n=1 Tax=Dunaliella salina TaxID=3046 RepID=A0ABQ7GI65_DUNSA|nr:hypothetical protein DUNSADRAFT_9050 [Dunaliella salina]|eukprot:KAF5834307.1 hypothetical protein DUNSADRAFT_9050 [Dunaliella salina]
MSLVEFAVATCLHAALPRAQEGQARPAAIGDFKRERMSLVKTCHGHMSACSTEESTGGGSQGSHGRRRKPVGHMRSIFSKARLTQAEVRALHGFASQVLERLDGSSRGKV